MVLAISMIGGTAQVVRVHRVWHVDLAPQATYQFVVDHPPRGMTDEVTEHASDSDGSAAGISFDWSQPVPAEIGQATLQASVTADPAGGSWVYVDAEASWRQRRPADEHVDARDVVLTVSQYRGSIRGTPVRTRVVTNPHAVTAIVNAFNALAVQVPISQSCPADFGDSPVYRVEFSRRGGATADVVAVVNTFCVGGTAVTVHGRSSFTLDNGDLPRLLAAALA
jgi:hypothetical protein